MTAKEYLEEIRRLRVIVEQCKKEKAFLESTNKQKLIARCLKKKSVQRLLNCCRKLKCVQNKLSSWTI